jgi:hypothetical protein
MLWFIILLKTTELWNASMATGSSIGMNSGNRLKDKAASIGAEQFAIRLPPFGVDRLPRD